MIILWDEPKRLQNLASRDLDFAALDADFFENATELTARDGRRMAVGRFHGRILAVVFKRLGSEAISVVSMRVANRKERSLP